MEQPQATFLVEHREAEKGLVKQFIVSYYADGSLSMLDIEAKRTFLKVSRANSF